ncbi:MAG: bifunctional diaminohydroxyphosphoribosylaminopyrimidine deaminase/5-amino-6-(5-phosphoribosylamino)uracil reductase RibD, partial [Acidobacteria bacterium]|nr:bifunctional diaminohydroxyphosphoribosylaminopyrimidine deaminase/5-amino-6-(5-phosphoribosylamino)uracil reductase RibD [Acidobacteriota bacterium]
MEEALCLAGMARKSVLPNPRVGSLVVKKGKIVGRGTHKGPGRPHAEIVALRGAGRRARGATLYVTLEPCRHTGRTPPCTEAILAAEVKRVFYAVGDPNPLVKGKGARALRRAGIEVELVGGPVAREARKLNTAYFHFHKTGRPHITAKVATTLDGKIATAEGYSKWITDKNARAFARRLRGEHQAVLVGIETVLADNPRLTVRGKTTSSSKKAAGPLQIVL